MAKARALDRRRRSVRNIRKITRTMELIATARFKKAMDRSVAARDYTRQLSCMLANIASSGIGVVHPLLEVRPNKRTAVLILTGNRGLCGGYNSNIVRQSLAVLGQWKSEGIGTQVAVSGKKASLHFVFEESRSPIDIRPLMIDQHLMPWNRLDGPTSMDTVPEILIDSMSFTQNFKVLQNNRQSSKHFYRSLHQSRPALIRGLHK